MEDLQEVAEQIFVTLLGLDSSEREAYLKTVRHDSPEVMARVEKLLKEEDLAGSFLKHPLFEPQATQGGDVTSPKATSGIGDAETPPHVPQFAPGEVLCDRFEVIRFIAKGGMGEVYEVADRQLRGVHVALKTVLSQYAADPLMQQRFEREVLNAREVIHPNICPIYDIFHWTRTEGRLTFLTMKLLAGETLSARLARAGAIGDPEASLIIRQVGAGLSAAHEAGILHRDIKAANIILDGSGEKVHACVTDFGLARPAHSETTALTLHGIAGTLGYMAPELFYGSAPTRASDVYSFGVVLHQVLTGELPCLITERVRAKQIRALSPSVPGNWKRLVEGCLNPDLAKRYASIDEAIEHIPANITGTNQPNSRSPGLSRRRMIGLSAAVCGGLAGAAWLEWPDILNIFEPLPKPRSVALMTWPAVGSPALLSTILDSISQRLARAEAYVKDLLIITARDVPPGGLPVDSPEKTQSILGANLVLLASLRQDASQAHVNLQLLDAMTQRVLRKGVASCRVKEISTLAELASQEAAMLLRLPRQDVQLSDPEELRNVSPEVYQTFSEAEQLMREPNHSGLQQAILKYQRALELDSRFALGYAKLAIAYINEYLVTHEPGYTDLAEGNASNAVLFNTHSAMGLLSQALVLMYKGDAAKALTLFAKAVQADPGNPEILLYKAQAFENLGRDHVKDAEQVYRVIIAERPNFWPAYNNLGVLFANYGQREEAAEEFAAAGAAALSVALPMANLATTYIQLHRYDDARKALTESLRRSENEDGYLALGDLDFGDGKYTDALREYERAGKLAPMDHLAQRNIGDCYTMLGNPQLEKASYLKAAHLLSFSLQTNPQNGFGWANLAFYHAKVGDFASADVDLRNTEANGGTDLASQFMITQALAVMGRKKEALNRLEWCLDCNLSSDDLDLAIDLRGLRRDPAFLSYMKGRGPADPKSLKCKSRPS